MARYRLLISYDGTPFVGWQVQPNGVSIQGLIEKGLYRLLGEKIRIVGAGRTDSGVHALGQVAHFDIDEMIDTTLLARQLNGLLPREIRILHCALVLPTFHAQRSATSKEYHYHLWLEREISPFVRLYRHHIRKPCSPPLLREAAQRFVGKHDFATFANVGSKVTTTERTIFRLDIIPQEGGLRLEFEGDGFLYKMVRNIVGTLVEVATEKRPLEAIETLFAAKDRRATGVAAPPQGLFLVRVDYPTRFTEHSLSEE